MKFKYLVLYIYLLQFVCLSLNAQATERDDLKAACQTKDYSSELGPVRSQGSSEFCTYEVAADLLGFELNLGPKFQVSSADMAINWLRIDPINALHSSNDVDKLFDYGDLYELAVKNLLNYEQLGGNVALNIQAYNDSGKICLENEIPSQEKTFIKRDSVYFLKNMFKKWSEPSDKKENYTNSICEQHNLNPIENYDLFKNLKDYLVRDLISKFLKKTKDLCENSIAFRKKLVVTENHISNTKMSAALELAKKFTELKKPIGLSIYDAGFFNNSKLPATHYANHSVILAGLKWNEREQKCEFKIRNSWGLCPEYNKTNVYANKHCEDGNIWITEEQMNQFVDSYTYINPN